jgi:hypothetical protein
MRETLIPVHKASLDSDIHHCFVYRFGTSTKAGVCRLLSVIPAPSHASTLAKTKSSLGVTMETYGYGHFAYNRWMGWTASLCSVLVRIFVDGENSDVFTNTNCKRSWGDAKQGGGRCVQIGVGCPSIVVSCALSALALFGPTILLREIRSSGRKIRLFHGACRARVPIP